MLLETSDVFLIDLVHTIHANPFDWTNGPPDLHNVNFSQGFREPAQYGVLAHDPKFFRATERQYHDAMAEFGQMTGGGFAGNENARHGYRDPRQGFETCGIAEYMLSFRILTRQSGSPVWMDRCEELAFNMLPASYDSEQKSLHYVTSMNIAQIDNTVKGSDFDNPWAMQAFMPGAHNYRCCPHNYGLAVFRRETVACDYRQRPHGEPLCGIQSHGKSRLRRYRHHTHPDHRVPIWRHRRRSVPGPEVVAPHLPAERQMGPRRRRVSLRHGARQVQRRLIHAGHCLGIPG